MANVKNPEVELEEVAISIHASTNDQISQMGSPYLHKVTCPSPEISKSSPNSGRPPKYRSSSPSLSPSRGSPLTRRRTFKSQPKSRFGEPSVPIDSQTFENLASPRFDGHGFEIETPPCQRGLSFVQQKEEKKEKEGPDEMEIYSRVTAQLSARNTRRMTVKLVLQLFVFLLILSCLVCSLTLDIFEGKELLGLQIWKWFVLLMVIFSGMLLSNWVVHFIVFLMEWKFLLKKNVLYFTHGLRSSVVGFIWISVVLVTWFLLFRPDIKRTPKSQKIIDFITRTLMSFLIGSFMWLIKTTLVKMLAASFHVNRSFDRIQESIFHHYVLQMLSGRPLVEWARMLCREDSHVKVSFTEHTGSCKEKKVIDWAKLHQMKREKVPSWTMQLLIDVVSNSGLSTVSGLLKQNVVEGGVQLDDNEITSEEEAIATAFRVFHNVVEDKDDQNYIDESDLLRFMIREEVELVYPLFELNENRQITLKAFSRWVVRVYKDRRTLHHALNDNKTAVKQLSKLLSGILIVLTIVLWLLLTEIATTKILVFFSSQLVVAAFIFGNTCKTIFEAIIFVFVMHPFDVGDRCVIDETVMLVEEMNILTTVFLKIDKEKVYYPNAILSTKPISNYYRSPDQGDTFDFTIDYRTPLSTITELKDRIKKYLEQNHNLWQPDHNVIVREIENANKIKMTLFFFHTMNFQDFPEKTRRRTQLILDVKAIFDDLRIIYNLLPQEIHLRNIATTN